MSEKLTVTITNQKGRLDKLLTEQLADYSRSQIQSWLKDGLVFSITAQQVVKANYKVKAQKLLKFNYLKCKNWKYCLKIFL